MAAARPDRQRGPAGSDAPAGRRGALERIASAWRQLAPEQRLAAVAAGGLFGAMFLPWYTKANTVVVAGVPKTSQIGLSAFDDFSFVEAAVLLVSVGVLYLLFARAERRAFHLPGGDGLVIMVAGGWAALLIVYRMFSKPTLHGNQLVTATEGVTWGIFVALLVAIALAYAGSRVRHAARPEPPLEVHEPRRRHRDQEPAPPEMSPRAGRAGQPAPVRAGGTPAASAHGPDAPTAAVGDVPEDAPPGRPRYPPPPTPGGGRRRPSRRMVTRADAEQLSFDDAPPGDPFED